jgi:menaquinone-dependent protoporphyrinogen oxidase
MKVLVTFASKHGSTREIAGSIAEVFRNCGLNTDLQEVTQVADIKDYDAVVLGSAIYAGNLLPEARSFAERFRGPLSEKPLWLFSSGPLGAEDPQPHDDPQRIAATLGELPLRDHKIFVGRLDLDSLGFAERMITRVVKAPAGDFRDWESIKGWALKIATELYPVMVAQPR